MRSITVILVILVSILGCERSNSKSGIKDIWIGDYESRLLCDSSLNIHRDVLLLLDLSNKDSATIMNQGGYKYTTSWSLKDSVFILDSTEYKILSINKDSLIYSRSRICEESIQEEYPIDIPVAIGTKEENIVYRRISEAKFSKSIYELSDILSNKLFARSKMRERSWPYEQIEFLDNNVSIARWFPNSDDEMAFADECWKIIKYKGYAFIVFYRDWYRQIGIDDNSFQLLKISDSEFSINANLVKKPITYKCVLKTSNDLDKSLIIGKWYNKNETSKNEYRGGSERIINRLIEEGTFIEYDDTLFYNFFADSVLVSTNLIEPKKFRWKFNSDNTLIVLEDDFHWLDTFYTRLEYVRFNKLTRDTLHIELIDNFLDIGIGEQRTLILNNQQLFKKVE